MPVKKVPPMVLVMVVRRARTKGRVMGPWINERWEWATVDPTAWKSAVLTVVRMDAKGTTMVARKGVLSVGGWDGRMAESMAAYLVETTEVSAADKMA